MQKIRARFGTAALFASLLPMLSGAVLLDRIAVVAGKHAIKDSDIDRDIRLTEFLNREPLKIDMDARKQSASRLIDQAIIRDEIANGGYPRATDAEAEAMLTDLRRDRFAGSDARMRQNLAQYGLTEDDLHDHLLWQLTVLRFIDERFRPGITVSDSDVHTYYEQHLPQLKREYPKDNSYTALEAKIRNSLEGEKVNQQFDTWLDEARKAARVEFREETLG